MKTTTLHLDMLIVPPGLRALNEDTITGLMKSLKDIGMQTPVTYYDNDDGDAVLVAGVHRVAAAKRLDWGSVEGIEMDAGDTRELWAIDENLMRADLTDLERADHTDRRTKLLKKQAGIIKGQIGPKPPGRPSEGIAEIAKVTGKSITTVKRTKSRGEKIIRKVKEQIKDMPVAKSGVELDALAAMKPHQQVEAVHKVKTGVAKDFREAKTQMTKQTTTGKNDTIDIEFGHLKMVWHRAGVTAKKKFRVWLKDQP